MKWFRKSSPEQRSGSLENPTMPVSSDNFLQFFGLSSANLPTVTIDSAMNVPAVQAAVLFLSRTLAAVPLRAFARSEDGPQPLRGKLQTVLEENPNDHQDGVQFRKFFWEQVFTGGRGLAWIERNGNGIEALWPLDPTRTTITAAAGVRRYTCAGQTYDGRDVIDVAFMLKPDGVSHRGPIAMGSKAIQLALSMNDYGAQFFAGGGIPPLGMEGPMPAGPDAMKRAMGDMRRAIDAARQSKHPIFQMPPGYKLTPVGFDPEKGQMTEARLFQVQEIARIYQIPPSFLQDLSRATFSNVEQNDIHLVKHLVGQWAAVLEGEMNLKLFGRMNNRRYVKHDLDGLMRGDFKSLLEGATAGIQGAVYTPNEAREKVGLPRLPEPDADRLHIQGATVPIGRQVQEGAPPAGVAPTAENDSDDQDEDVADDENPDQ